MTGLDLTQVKNEIVRPALALLGLGGEAAVNLLTGTALVESGGIYLRQRGGGPALGLWQMEPATHDDCWANFLRYPAQSRLATLIRTASGCPAPVADRLVWDLRYACLMARIRYYRVRAPLPPATDAAALSRYHKQHYNTPLGAADPVANTPLFARAIAA